MDISRQRQRIASLIVRRRQLENENMSIGPMVKGSLIKHYKKCGNKGCVCEREGKLHGPYWYLSYKKEGQVVLEYVSKMDLVRIGQLSRNYKKFQSNMAAIRKINSQIIKLLSEIKEYRLREGREK